MMALFVNDPFTGRLSVYASRIAESKHGGAGENSVRIDEERRHGNPEFFTYSVDPLMCDD